MSFFTLSKQLKEPYKSVFDRVYLYANVQEITEEDSNDAMLNLYDVLFTAQTENKPVEQIVGDDIETFCQSYFDQRKLHRFITSIPKRLYDLALWIVGIELFFFVGDSLFGQVEGDINLSPYLLGLLVSLLLTPIGHLAYHFLVRKVGLKPAGFYGTIFVVSILFLIGIFYLSGHFVVMGSRLWTIAITSAYVLPYKLFQAYQTYQKFGTWYNLDERLVKEETKKFKKQGFQLYVESELHQTYAKRFKKHMTKGKSSESFYLKLEKELQRDKVLSKWYWVVGVLIGLIFSIPIYLKESLTDALLFTLIGSMLVIPILFFVNKLISDGFPTRETWLQKAAPHRANLQDFFNQKETDK